MNVELCYSILLTLLLMESCMAQTKARQKCKTFILKSYRRINRSASPSIVGGEPTNVSEFPHMVALGYGDNASPQFLCGGSLISDQYVLTAAHCTNLSHAGPVKMIRAGTRSLAAKRTFKDFKVETIINHPDYKSPSTYNDIALLKLQNKVRFSFNIFPACLRTTKTLTSRQEYLTALGWGKLNFAGPKPDNLQKVILQYISSAECNTSYLDASKGRLALGVLDDIQICAGGNVPKDTCQGDSGGPLECRYGRLHFIVGITSFGKACGISGAPGVYTRVSAYVPWIESIAWP